MEEFNFNSTNYDDKRKILEDSVGFVKERDDELLPTLNNFSQFVEGIFRNETLVKSHAIEKIESSSTEYHLANTDCFLQLSSSKNSTDSSRNIELKFIKPEEDQFCVPEILNINLDSELGKNIIFKMRDNILAKYDKGMGHLLAEACIKAELSTNTPIFYSRIGCETRDGHYVKCDSNLSQDISNAVRSAKLSDPPKSIATIMVSCRYSSSGTSDNGHTICIAVNTDKFDENGELLRDSEGSPIKLTPQDCAIIDSSKAIVNTVPHDNGTIEIFSQLNQIIDTGNIKAYSLYPESIQVGPKCSDYARRAYQKLSSGYCTNIADLKNRSFEFANSIHESVQRDYERVFVENIPRDIRGELSIKKPKKKDYPSMIPSRSRATPLAFRRITGPRSVRYKTGNSTSEDGDINISKNRIDSKCNPVLRSLDFRPRFNQYVRSNNFSPTKLSKVTNKSGPSIF